MNRPNDSIAIATDLARAKMATHYVYSAGHFGAWKVSTQKPSGIDHWAVTPDGRATPSDGRDPRAPNV